MRSSRLGAELVPAAGAGVVGASGAVGASRAAEGAVPAAPCGPVAVAFWVSIGEELPFWRTPLDRSRRDARPRPRPGRSIAPPAVATASWAGRGLSVVRQVPAVARLRTTAPR